MQEVKITTERPTHAEADEKHVTVFLQGIYYHLAGNWQWELQSSAVFCSDVMMAWPADFTGTRSIFHPDDVPAVKEALSAAVNVLSFRIITTYGEVKRLEGTALRLAEADAELPRPGLQLAVQTETDREAGAEAARAKLQRAVFDYAERLSKTGVWHTNLTTGETWFSDELYRIMGLPPQTLNAHPNTLYPFIHADDRKEVIDALDDAYAKSFPLHLEFRIIPAGGSERWVRHTTAYGFNDRGQRMLQAVVQDVTEEKEGERLCAGWEAEIGFQKQLLHFAESATSAGYWQINLVTKKITYSDNFYRLFGLRPQGAVAHISVLNTVHPDDRETYEAAQAQIRREHTAPEIEYRIVRPDGKTRHIRQRGKAIISGAEVLVVGTVQDITVQRSLERKLAETQRLLEVKDFAARQAETMAGIGSWIWNVHTSEIAWSDAFYDLLGVKPVVNKPTQALLLRAIHPDDQMLFGDELSLALKEHKESAFHFRLIRRGEVLHLRASFKLLLFEGEELFIGTLQDVTSEQKTLQSLTERVRLIELLADSIPEQVMVTDADNTVVLWNRTCEEVYKRKRSTTVGENLFDVLPGLKQDFILDRFGRVMAGEEVHLKDEPGRYTLRGFFNTSHIPLKEATGAVSGILHIIRNVTADHNLHEQLTTRLSFIERLLEVSVDRIVALDHHMNYLYWNKAAEEAFGLRGEQVIGRNILEVFPEVPELSYADFRQTLRGEVVHRPATDEQPAESYLIPVKDDRGDVTNVLWVQRDRSHDFVIQRQSQKALEIFNALNENYLELNKDFRVLFINNKALEFFKRPEEEVKGKVLWEVYPEAVDTPLHIALVHAQEERLVIRREFASPRYGISLLVSIAPTVDGIAVAFSDISFIKEAERQIAEEHRRLKEAQNIGSIGSFEWAYGEEHVAWSDEMYRICNLEPQSERITVDRTERLVLPEDLPRLLALKESSFTTPGHYRLQHRILLDDGTVKWVTHRFESEADEAGNVVRIHGTLQDVTEQKQAEEDLRHFRQQWQQLLNNTPDIITRWSTDLRLLSCNEAFLKTTGIRVANPVGKTHAELGFSTEGSRRFIDDLREVITTGQPAVRYMEYMTPEGTKQFQTRLFGELDQAGTVAAVGTLTTDVTELKESERRLLWMQEELAQRAADKYQRIINSMEQGFCVIECLFDEHNRCVNWRYVDANPVFKKQSGFEAAIGKTINELVTDVEPFWKETYGAVALTGKPVRVENGVTSLNKWFDVYAFRVDAPEEHRVAILFNDITERKKAEEALRQSEEQKSFSLKLADALRFLKNARTIQGETARLLREHFNAGWSCYCQFDESSKHITVLQDSVRAGLLSLAGGHPFSDMPEFLARWQKGKSVQVEDFQSSPLLSQRAKELYKAVGINSFLGVPLVKDGQLIAALVLADTKPRAWPATAVALATESAERTRAAVERANVEEALHQLEETQRLQLEHNLQNQTAFAQTIVDASVDQITIFDIQERFLVWNKKAEETGGLMRQDVIGKTIAEVFPGIIDEPEFLEAQQKALAGEMVYIPAKRGIYSTAYHQWFYVPLKTENGEVYAVMNVIHDITDKVEAEEELRQKNNELAAKAEEITQFAFIASHDLKEPLRKIYTFSNWLMEKEADGLTVRGKEMVFKMHNAVKRLDNLIADITALTRLDAVKEKAEDVDLFSVLREAVVELAPEIEASSAVVDGGALPVIKGHRKQLVLLFKSLISNGIKFHEPDVVPVVEVRTGEAEAPEALPPGRYIFLSFADNGIGFDPQYADQIFKVFQRLHGQAEYPGTGIGLAMCKKIMENHNGTITTESAPGRGATFRCWFPG